MSRKPTNSERLAKIAEIIESVENRCMAADGPVTPTHREITADEIAAIYLLAVGARPERLCDCGREPREKGLERCALCYSEQAEARAEERLP